MKFKIWHLCLLNIVLITGLYLVLSLHLLSLGSQQLKEKSDDILVIPPTEKVQETKSNCYILNVTFDTDTMKEALKSDILPGLRFVGQLPICGENIKFGDITGPNFPDIIDVLHDNLDNLAKENLRMCERLRTYNETCY